MITNVWPVGFWSLPRDRLTTYCQMDDGWWAAHSDAAWAPGGIWVGSFDTLAHAIAFIYGGQLVQAVLPLEGD